MIAWYEPALVLMVVAGMLAAFISDRYRPEAVALAAPVIFLVTGIVDVGEALQSFSQPAPFTKAVTPRAMADNHTAMKTMRFSGRSTCRAW